MKNWLASGVTADYVFRVLKLEKEKLSLLWSPLLKTWVSYVKMLPEKPNPYELLLAKMKTQYTDDAALTALASAQATERVAPLARKVEEVQLDKWMRKALSADDAFKLLKPNSADENILNNPWVSYVTKLDETNADEQMFVILKRSYSEQDLALILARSKGFLRGDVAKRMEGCNCNYG